MEEERVLAPLGRASRSCCLSEGTLCFCFSFPESRAGPISNSAAEAAPRQDAPTASRGGPACLASGTQPSSWSSRVPCWGQDDAPTISHPCTALVLPFCPPEAAPHPDGHPSANRLPAGDHQTSLFPPRGGNGNTFFTQGPRGPTPGNRAPSLLAFGSCV